MQHTYIVTGMTCNNCKAAVEKAVTQIEGVDNAKVILEKKELVVNTSKQISLAIIQRALPEKYSVFENKTTSIQFEEKTELQQLFPLFLIFIFITGASILLHYNPWDFSGFMLDFMGLFYVVFSFFKLLDLKGFPESFKMYDPLAKQIPIYGWLYPFIELALGILFLMRIKIPLTLVITIILLGITTFGVTKTLLDKKSIPCACLGTALKLPMTKATFIENSIMIVMAIIMLFKTYS